MCFPFSNLQARFERKTLWYKDLSRVCIYVCVCLCVCITFSTATELRNGVTDYLTFPLTICRDTAFMLMSRSNIKNPRTAECRASIGLRWIAPLHVTSFAVYIHPAGRGLSVVNLHFSNFRCYFFITGMFLSWSNVYAMRF